MILNEIILQSIDIAYKKGIDYSGKSIQLLPNHSYLVKNNDNDKTHERWVSDENNFLSKQTKGSFYDGELAKMKKNLENVGIQLDNIHLNIEGWLFIDDPIPTKEGKYLLVQEGTYSNLIPVIHFGEIVPSTIPITVDKKSTNAIVWTGEYFIQLLVTSPDTTAFIEDFATSNFPLIGKVQRVFNGKIWELNEGEEVTINENPEISPKWTLISLGVQEKNEINLLKKNVIRDVVSNIVFSVLDNNNRMSWLSIGEDGGMPDFVKDYIVNFVRDKVFTSVITNNITFSIVDSTNRMSWLSIGEDGGMPDFVKNYISNIVINTYDSGTKSIKSKIICVGDSITEGGSPGLPYPAHLKNLLPETTDVLNIGMSGKMSAPIAIKYGGVKIFLTNNITIPASGSVSGKFTRESSTGNINEFSYDCSIANIAGTISITSATDFSFTRATNGVSTAVNSGVEIVSKYVENHDNIPIFWTGQNDLAWGWPYAHTAPIMSIKACVNAMDVDVKRFLVIGVTTGASGYKEDVILQNNNLKEEFPNNFVDMNNIFIDKGLEMAGITPTSEDLTAIANGLVPPSLLYDGVHPNDICKEKVIAVTIYEELRKREWL